jgi:tetratricopeptide (TPR) repeat protein
MITETPAISLSSADRSQLHRIDLARGAWKEGRADDALILIDSVKRESMSARVKAECYVAEGAFYAERGEFARSLESLKLAAPVIESAPVSVRGSFYFQRARAYKELGDYDSALTDYAGAEVVLKSTGSAARMGAVALNLAGCYLALGDLAAAQLNVSKSLKLLEESKSFYLPHAHDTQAKIFLEEGKLEQAAEFIRVALAGAGENETWRSEFLETKERIETKLLVALRVNHLTDWDRVKIDIVRRALKQAGGSPAKAAEALGVTRHAVFSLVKTHGEELEQYRKPKRKRAKSIMK